MRKARSTFLPLLFSLPLLIIYVPFQLVPIIGTILFSFVKPGSKLEFAFFDHVNKLVSDTVIIRALLNNFIWIIFSMFIPVIIGLIMASLIGFIPKGRSIFRFLIFFPVPVAYAVIGAMWSPIYHPYFGLINSLLKSAGLIDRPIVFLSPDLAIWSLLVVNVWGYYPLTTIIFLASLQKIPSELYESARVDGANVFQTFLHITLPLLKPAISFLLILIMLQSVGVFDLIWIMTRGGPGHATEVLGTWAYQQAFLFFDYGYACTISLLIAIVTLPVAVYMLVIRRGM